MDSPLADFRSYPPEIIPLVTSGEWVKDLGICTSRMLCAMSYLSQVRKWYKMLSSDVLSPDDKCIKILPILISLKYYQHNPSTCTNQLKQLPITFGYLRDVTLNIFWTLDHLGPKKIEDPKSISPIQKCSMKSTFILEADSFYFVVNRILEESLCFPLTIWLLGHQTHVHFFQIKLISDTLIVGKTRKREWGG